MGKRLGIILLALIGLVFLTGLGLYAFRQPVLESLISYQLHKYGIPVQSLAVADASLNTLTLHTLSLGSAEELHTGTIFVTWNLQDLLAGELEAVEISGLQLALNLSGELPPLGSLQQLIPAGEKKAGARRLPAISLRDANMSLHTAFGDFIVGMNGDIDQSESGTQSTRLTFNIAGPPGRTKGKLAATMDASGNIQGKITVSEGTLGMPEAEISGLRGDATFTLVDMLPQQLNAEFVLFDINLPGSGLEENAFEQAKLSLQMNDATAQLKGDLLAGDKKLALLFDTTVRNYMREPTIDLDINAHGSADSYAWKLLGLPQPSTGSVALTMKASGQTPPLQEARSNWLSWLQHSTLTGQGNLELQGLSYTQKVSTLNGKLALSAEFANGSGKALLTDDSIIEASSLNPSWLESLGMPAELAKLFTQGGRLHIAGKNGKATLASLSSHAEGTELNFAAAAKLSTAKAQANMNLHAQTTLDTQNKLTAFKLSDIAVQTTGIRYADTLIEHMTLKGAIRGSPNSWTGKLDLEADANPLTAGPLTANQANMTLPIQLKFDHDTLHINLRKPGHVTLGKLAPVGSVSLQGPLDLSVSQADIELGQNPQGLRLKHQITVVPKNFSLLVEREAAPVIEAQIRPGEITLRGELDVGEKYRGQSVISAAGLTLPQSQIQLDNISTTINLGLAGIGKVADFSIGRLQHMVSAPYFAPHSISGNVQSKAVYGKPVNGKPVSYSISAIGGVQNAQYLKLSGEHALDSGVGKITLDIDPLSFSPDVLQPGALFPDLALLENVSGKVDASTQITWSKEGISSSGGVLDLQNMSFVQKDITISGLNATLKLSDLLSPKSPPGQKITIQHIDLGVPIDNLAVSYQIQATVPPRIAIEKANLALIGGMMSLGPTVIDPSSSHTDMVILVNNLDLEDLFGLIQVEGLTGNGRLDGSIPVTIDGNLVTIQNGHLVAEAPGILRFKSEKASQMLAGAGSDMNLLLQALQEFHYSELILKLDKSPKDDLVATLSLLGNNPNVSGGRLFRLNINLESNIGKLLDTIGLGYRLSNDALRKAFSLR